MSKKPIKPGAVSSELPAHALRHRCDPTTLPFETTDELPDLQNVIGQPRALRALELGSQVEGPGYNTFVIGISGSGRTTLTHEYLDRKAEGQPVPDDWCYVFNFENPRCPRALRLPPGRGQEFSRDIQDLLSRSEMEIAQAYESEAYIQERDRLMNSLKSSQAAELSRLQEHVEKYNFVLMRTPVGFVLAPAVEGKPLEPKDLEALSPEQRGKLSQLQSRLSEDVEKAILQLRNIEKAVAEKLEELNKQTVLFLLNPLMGRLKEKYAGIDSVQSYLNALETDLLENAHHFRRGDETEPKEPLQVAMRGNWLQRYQVNSLVNNGGLAGAPVVIESHPSYPNLIGRIEIEYVMGASRTDFTMIRPGALHRANGGYLIIPARDLMVNPYAWEGLKRGLRDGEIRIVEAASQLGMISNVTLEPEPIPLDVKVILIGNPALYYMLRTHDEDFAKLFKVRAEFATSMERNTESEYEYGLFVKSVVMDNHLPPFDRSAVARIIEHSSRLADDQSKLTTRFGKIADLVREAAYWAGDSQRIGAEAVEKAIQESIYRSNLYEEKVQELIIDGTILIDASGSAVGQINGLSVLSLGDYTFGKPSRITAAAFPGKNGVIDIERQAKLGGPIHTKGILILSGLMGVRYGRNQPLNLSASLTFEQSYDEVEGDSASAAELFALLSAISKVPLRQDRAITGSINQMGQIQPIGGVNEKIEGFFAVCKAKGLSGEQGVIIPASNTRNLMLHQEVVAAVEAGQFHIWPIHTIEEGIYWLSGQPAGEPQPDGSYLEGTFNHAVMAALSEFGKAGEHNQNQKAASNQGSEHA